MSIIDKIYRALHPNEFSKSLINVDHAASRPGHYGDSTVSPIHQRPIFQRVSPTQENNLLITTFSAFDAILVLSGFIRRPGGELTPIGQDGAGFQIKVTGDRKSYTQSFAIGSDVVVQSISVVAVVSPINIPVNACWAIVQSTRTLSDGSSSVTGTLVSGPVTLLQPLAYPGSVVQKTADTTGFHRVLQFPNPAAGQEISITVPAGARWQINTLQFQLASNATAGSREILLRYTSATTTTPQTEFSVEAQGTLQAPSMTCQYAYGVTLAPLVSGNFGIGASSTTRQSGLPGNRFLLSGESLVTQTSNLAGGDQYSAIILGVVEVLDPAAPAGALPPILSFAGALTGSQNMSVTPQLNLTAIGVYVITVNQNMTVQLYGTAGGGGGQNGVAGVDTANGGAGGLGARGGAATIKSNPIAIQLEFGKSYTLTVGAGGVPASGGVGGNTKFVNTTDAITIWELAGGQINAGGTVITGVGIASPNGGAGGIDNGNNNGTAGAVNAGGAGSGGGGGAGQGNFAAGGSGAGGNGNSVTPARNGANGVTGGGSNGGGGGRGATGVVFAGLAGDFGAGAGGGGGGGENGSQAAGAGGIGGPGVAIFSFVSAP